MSAQSAVKRVKTPLTPVREVPTVVDDNLVNLRNEAVTVASVGHKAHGLASLPSTWTKPFFVVPAHSNPSKRALSAAVTALNIRSGSRLIVRSSGIDESIEKRGALDSAECDPSDLALQLAQLKEKISCSGSDTSRIHWVIQELLGTLAKGHLSNESRVAEDKRDWMAEVEASATYIAEGHRISLRTWRDNSVVSETPLNCPYREMYLACLNAVAKWAYQRLIRVHFEWVWDGRCVYLVQVDTCDEIAGGMHPSKCVQAPKKEVLAISNLTSFHRATTLDFDRYRKLSNARMYRELGYSMVDFYVMDSRAEFEFLLNTGACSPALIDDLVQLVRRPLVIRTDGFDIPDDLKQMLPRSDELRSLDAAVLWLKEFAATAARSTSLSGVRLRDCSLCLVAHHFVPAVASAWCQARPDQRRVRIESLWGIPEGLYWHAYDSFDVDTQLANGVLTSERPLGMKVRQKKRFKEHFIAPDESGKWILHRSAAGPDWQRSITKTEWIEEIAWTSRKIAARAGRPVVVMWFIGIPGTASTHRVLPWYHEPWAADASLQKAAPRKKFASSADFVLRGRSDWESLKNSVTQGNSIARVRVQPREPDIVRDPEFAKELGAFANKHHLTIELEGGILSHAYYMLTRTGCAVECADLDDYATDEYELDFNKLVRDKIPNAISDRGEAVMLLRLEGEALIAALRRKLVEEAFEVLDARTNDEIAEELADLREVALALMSRLKITENDVELIRRRKVRSRGAFDSALMLTKTAIAPSLSLSELDGQLPDAERQQISGTISQVAAIPAAFDDLHVDRRVDSAGNLERQFSATLPAHASGFKPARVPFSLDTPSGQPHEMVLDLQLERRGPELRLRARLHNRSVQLTLELEPNSDGG